MVFLDEFSDEQVEMAFVNTRQEQVISLFKLRQTSTKDFLKHSVFAFKYSLIVVVIVNQAIHLKNNITVSQ